MNLVVLLILTLLLFIVSYVVDAGQVILVDSNITRSFVDMEADFCEFLCLFCLQLRFHNFVTTSLVIFSIDYIYFSLKVQRCNTLLLTKARF